MSELKCRVGNQEILVAEVAIGTAEETWIGTGETGAMSEGMKRIILYEIMSLNSVLLFRSRSRKPRSRSKEAFPILQINVTKPISI